MTIGDLVLVNAFMIQLYIPLNFLGVIYREIKQAMADMERLFALIEENAEIRDKPGAPPLAIRGAEVRFEHVYFGYEANRQILFDVSFTIPSGRTVAVVGPSGAGKSTLGDCSTVSTTSTAGVSPSTARTSATCSDKPACGDQDRAADTVLFNDSIEYNIAYEAGRTATRSSPPRGWRDPRLRCRAAGGFATPVGERGLKLSGGEKQRVAIARAS
jgi:ATP-binding cassette subfamily B protein